LVVVAWHERLNALTKTLMESTALEEIRPDSIPIGYRLRKDIAWHSHADGRTEQPTWIAEDPLTRRMFRCGDREYRILDWLDSATSIESIQTKFNAEFAPETIDPQAIRELISQCNQSGLLRPANPGRTATPQTIDFWPQSIHALVGQSQRPRSRTEPVPQAGANWLWMLIRWLAKAIGNATQTQVSLVSPDRWLGVISARLGFLYSGAAVWIWLSALGVVAGFIGMRWARFSSELPDFDSLRSPGLLVGYGAIFIVTRVIHELGHAVVCKRVGAACKDAGVMVSFGMLCPYVDITDAWKIGSRLKRMGVALAGIYSECILASFAAVIWLSTHPGWIHHLAMQTLLVCTVTTLLFNANPLMKYDGYFVLCDWLNIQNLREKSFETLDALLDGRARRYSPGLSLFLVLYFFASTLNRVTLIAGLASMVYFVASQWQLAGIGIAMIVFYGCCALVTSMAAWTINLDTKSESRKISRRAVWLGWTAVSLLIAWAVNIPLPSKVSTNGAFQIGERQPVYVSIGGRIHWTINAATSIQVESASPILSLSNSAVERNAYELETQLLSLDRQVEMLERLVLLDLRWQNRKTGLHSDREKLVKQLEFVREQQSLLTVTAPVDGWFEPSIVKPADSPSNPTDVSLGFATSSANSWSTCWTSVESIGRALENRTLIGWVVQDRIPRIECKLFETQIAGIRVGTEVRVCIAQQPTKVFTGRVVELARSSQAIGSTTDFRSREDEVRPMSYDVRIAFDEGQEWNLYYNGNAEIVFNKPQQSILKLAMDTWMRDSKVR
jgi:putative peptide zinc metalloprotease protein